MAYSDEDREIPGFTEKQRQWFLDRDGNRCSMFTCIDGSWQRCQNTEYLHIHHVTPRGWYAQHSNRTWDVNDETNGIVLCQEHHVGKYADFSDRFVIHADVRNAWHLYRQGDEEAYDRVDARHEELCSRGIPYWNTEHDWLFYRLVRYRNRMWQGREYPQRYDVEKAEGKDTPWYVNELSDSQLFK